MLDPGIYLHMSVFTLERIHIQTLGHILKWNLLLQPVDFQSPAKHLEMFV